MKHNLDENCAKQLINGFHLLILCRWPTCDIATTLQVGSEWVYATGLQKEEDGKTLVCDKRDRAVTCVFCCDLHLTLLFPFLLHRDVIKGMWSLAKSFLKQNYCHARHTRFNVFFPLPPCWVNSLLFRQIKTFANDLTSGKYCWQVWRVHFRSQLKYFRWRGILANKYCMYFISWILLSSPTTRHWFS